MFCSPLFAAVVHISSSNSLKECRRNLSSLIGLIHLCFSLIPHEDSSLQPSLNFYPVLSGIAVLNDTIWSSVYIRVVNERLLDRVYMTVKWKRPIVLCIRFHVLCAGFPSFRIALQHMFRPQMVHCILAYDCRLQIWSIFLTFCNLFSISSTLKWNVL
jgi:hypothetical protein